MFEWKNGSEFILTATFLKNALQPLQPYFEQHYSRVFLLSKTAPSKRFDNHSAL
ncbi:MAG: hypothetical protein ACI8RD_004000 [Bacillariaceae sp.]|jgi:hypothetical protein